MSFWNDITDQCIRKYEKLVDYLYIESDQKNQEYIKNIKLCLL